MHSIKAKKDNKIIVEVTQSFISNMLENGNEGTFAPTGLFYMVTKENNAFIGIDNADGNAWTEEFKTQKYMLKWLNDGVTNADDIRQNEKRYLKYHSNKIIKS